MTETINWKENSLFLYFAIGIAMGKFIALPFDFSVLSTLVLSLSDILMFRLFGVMKYSVLSVLGSISLWDSGMQNFVSSGNTELWVFGFFIFRYIVLPGISYSVLY